MSQTFFTMLFSSAFSSTIIIALAATACGFCVSSSRAEEGSAVDAEQVAKDPNAKLIRVPYEHQLDVVYGCEAVSATMALQFYSVDITWRQFTDEYLITKPWHVDENGECFGPDPYAAYPGNPYQDSGPNCGFGCYAPALAKAMNKVLPQDKLHAVVTSNLKLCDLVMNYIDKGEPVVMWATMDMLPSRLTRTWTIDYVDENSHFRLGDKFTWNGNEHCLVLVGYDAQNYFFNDPYKNHGLIAYPKELVEQRFREQGSQSLVVQHVEQ
ncbi:MAG: C39 family peptidase [Planctomycetia bacterium]|nr:C39 family peptidase [Planctomycetia bacterium]